jgi:hypothetical protein
MEAMLGISLYSYLYLKLAKSYVFLIISMFSLQQIREQEGRTGSAQKWGSGEVAQTMYTHVSKTDKIKINNK